MECSVLPCGAVVAASAGPLKYHADMTIDRGHFDSSRNLLQSSLLIHNRNAFRYLSILKLFSKQRRFDTKINIFREIFYLPRASRLGLASVSRTLFHKFFRVIAK